MKKLKQFRITEMTISGFKCFREPTTFRFGPLTIITGGNGRGKSSIADAIAWHFGLRKAPPEAFGG